MLWVIASGVNDRIFDQRGARAIIQLAWREAEFAHFVAFFVVAFLILFYQVLKTAISHRFCVIVMLPRAGKKETLNMHENINSTSAI